MALCEQIRRLRRQRGLTQEEVARALGVTAPTVSKWERGTTLPDLGLLAPLARLLGTDANGLLAFQQEMDRQALADFAARLVQTAAADGVPAALALARTQRQQFPRSGALALTLALNLEGLLAMQAQEPAAADQAWLEELYHQEADSQDEAVAAQARAMLFGKAMASQEYDQAQQLLDRLPDRPLYHKEQMAAQLALARQDNAQAGRLLESQLLEQVSAVQTTLLTLMELAAREGRQADLAHLAQRAQAVGEDFQLSAYTVWVVRMEQACLTKDRAQGLAALEGLLAALEEPWPQGSSPFRRYLARESLDLHTMRGGILRELADPENQVYDFLRDDPRFQALVGKGT